MGEWNKHLVNRTRPEPLRLSRLLPPEPTRPGSISGRAGKGTLQVPSSNNRRRSPSTSSVSTVSSDRSYAPASDSSEHGVEISRAVYHRGPGSANATTGLKTLPNTLVHFNPTPVPNSEWTPTASDVPIYNHNRFEGPISYPVRRKAPRKFRSLQCFRCLNFFFATIP